MRPAKSASMMTRWALVALAGVALAGIAGAALVHSAQAAGLPTNSAGLPVHAPQPWEWWLQPSASPVEKSIDWMMQYVLWMMFGVVALVGLLIAYIVFRFNAKRNPVASTTTHNTLIEVIWTLAPAILLVAVVVPSLNLIYQQSDYKHPYMTVRVTGHQWYWEYSYNGAKGVDFTSYAIPPDKLKPGQIRQLSVDHPLVVPAGKKIVFQITSGDVLHSFFIPSLGVQRYAIPGQIWHQWTKIDAPGVYYGECNQICGMNHDNMPIEIVALPMKQFQAWLAKAKADAAQGNVPKVHPYEVLADNAVK
jgi:cytochrome c oxidase subunit 2